MNKAMKATLKALTFPDLDIKRSYKILRKLEKLTSKRIKKTKNIKIEDKTVKNREHDVHVRIFSPTGADIKGVVLFFHGGGWVRGDNNTYTGVCLDIMKELSRVVVSVDYRLAPEYKFPIALEDCYSVAKELYSGRLLEGYLAEDIVLMGDSAGGNLAAALSLLARDRGEFEIKRQILIYPSVAGYPDDDGEFDSVRENGQHYILTSKQIKGYLELYTNDESDYKDPYLAPYYADDLTRQPQTFVITSEFCPLRDEGEKYAEKLALTGNIARYRRMDGTIHGYFSLPVKYKPVRKTYELIRRFLGESTAEKASAAHWTRLDNAAKIFPPTTSKRDPRVFRFYCELNENINPNILKFALEDTLKSFEFYRCVLKKGWFWYYFEDSTIQPEVRKEYKDPCAKLYDAREKGLLFEVTYYKKRINLEVYHAISDGGGASRFLKELTASYLKRAHIAELANISTDFENSSGEEKVSDSFYKYYDKTDAKVSDKIKKAYHQKGERLESPSLGVIEGEMSVSRLLEISHSYGCTLSAFLISVLIKSIIESMPVRHRSKAVGVTVPVDLRQYFKSKSARNFFGVINVRYKPDKKNNELEDIIRSVTVSMAAGLDREKIAGRMSRMSYFENMTAARILPLFIKDIGLKIINAVNERGVTAVFSNLGCIKLPDELSPYINKIGVMCSSARLQACMSSYNDKFVITFTSPFVSTDIQRRFFSRLAKMGIDVEITSNLGRYGNEIL